MMSIQEAKKLRELTDRVDQLESEVVSLKSQVIASEAALALAERPRRQPRKQEPVQQ